MNERVRIADMDLLVGETQRIGIFTVADFSAFYRKFSTITEYLLSLEHIGNRDISTNFLRALPIELHQKIVFNITIRGTIC